MKLGPARLGVTDDPMGRDFVGLSPDQTPEQLFRTQPRALACSAPAPGVQRYVAFSSTVTKQVVIVVAKTGMENVGGGKMGHRRRHPRLR
ncbi:hypothetical protein AB0M02_10615 [Actinoplanes sp. NPDC051861]|uniref:hypothetical protein n=1 Tax=Actinoplanes sp. NPDC051861 TaxID=3155170 RepID=UPI003449BCAB